MSPHAARFAELESLTMYALLRLRSDVFVVEQHCAYPDLDGRDTEPGTTHVWYDHDGAPIAYLRILREPDGSVRLGRICTAAAHRGHGHAGRLVANALASVAPGTVCILDAQSHLVDFYRACGFHPTGPQFQEDGIPHTPMRLDRV